MLYSSFLRKLIEKLSSTVERTIVVHDDWKQETHGLSAVRQKSCSWLNVSDESCSGVVNIFSKE